jgi:hypothetical protein
LYRVITRPAADPFKTGMGTPATSVLPAYIFILHFEPRLMSVLYGMRYKKGRPSSGPLREESLEQLFNVDALNTEGGVQ